MSTTTNIRRQATVERIKEAEAVRADLSAALHAAGVPLPSLRLEASAYADEWPRPLVELGRCNVDTARRLAAALRDRNGQQDPTVPTAPAGTAQTAAETATQTATETVS